MRYLGIAFLTIVQDFCAGMHYVALAQKWPAAALLTGGVLPLLGAVSFYCFLEAKTRREKVLLALFNSAGVVVGVALTLWATT